MPLRDLPIRLDYRPDVSPDPVAEFYAPALAESVAYDRATYAFSANGLASAAAGLAGLLRNNGYVRLICHFEMEEPTVRAIIRGQVQAREAMLARVAPENLTAVSPDDIRAKSQIDLITWLIANRRLEVKIAIHSGGLFHSKIGVMADARGDRVAFEGSVNETAAGWSRNYESFSAFASWREPERVQSVSEHFDHLWNDRSERVRVVPMPDDYAHYLALAAPAEPPAGKPSPEDAARAEYWRRIRDALANDPASTVAAIPAVLWPHQESFRRARIDGDRRVLIADEVGLGKTMQAGIILKTLINRRAADRVLILAPKPALDQWQSELRDKFCLDIPILDTAAARPRLRYADKPPEPAPSPAWRAPRLIVSYHWLVRNAAAFLADAPRCDLAIVDEAHRARYGADDGPPNQFLTLLQGVSPLSDGMLLLTATPMQTAASDLWALIRVLEPDGWNLAELDDFYDDSADLTQDRIRRLRDLFTRDRQRPERPEPLDRVIWSDSPMVFNGFAAEPETRRAMLDRMRADAPIRRLMSRHTRDLLENYRRRGLLDAKMPRREVRAVPIEMKPAERRLYDGIDALIRDCYANPLVNETAFGFIMTIYRRRLGSSARAYAQTVRNLIERRRTTLQWDDLRPGEAPDDDEALPSFPLTADQKTALLSAASAADRLSRDDSKYAEFERQLNALRAGGHDRIIVFTQFRDTQIYLMERLENSAKHGEISAVWGGDSGERLTRPERIARVRERERGGVLICTETAAESLNLQFCSAIINYDMPWNPMTLEQRIGRIDRIGQERDTVEIVNLFYADTAEWDAYQAMEERLDAIGERVGPYRDILRSQLEGVIAAADRETDQRSRRAEIDAQLNRILAQMPPDRMPIDLDAHNSEITPQPPPAAPAVDMAYLRRCLDDPALLPTGWRAVPEGGPHWRVTNPAGRRFSVTTDRDAYEKANGRVKWFGPGSPAFPLLP